MYKPGKTMSSIIAKMTTTIEIVTGMTGFARIAPAVAIAAETPQTEMPDASTAATSRLKPNTRRAAA